MSSEISDLATKYLVQLDSSVWAMWRWWHIKPRMAVLGDIVYHDYSNKDHESVKAATRAWYQLSLDP